MNGIINVIKPPGMTSFDVVAYFRRILKIKKIGHTGTLDPGACGVLPICIGNATKAIEFLINKDKKYRAELTLGVETDTQDASGRILSSAVVNLKDTEIHEVMESFVGEIEQVPPMYSAVRVDGKRLYDLARSGISVERKPRKVQIYSINILQIKNNKVLFDVECSKGTYVRTLCADIGEKLGCGGHLSFLLRTEVGKYTLDSALTIEEIEEYSRNGKLNEKLFRVESIFNDLREIRLDDLQYKLFINGGFIRNELCNVKAGDMVRVYNSNYQFVALGEVVNRKGLKLKSRKQFI